MSEVQKEIPAMVEGLMPELPSTTGVDLPF